MTATRYPPSLSGVFRDALKRIGGREAEAFKSRVRPFEKELIREYDKGLQSAIQCIEIYCKEMKLGGRRREEDWARGLKDVRRRCETERRRIQVQYPEIADSIWATVAYLGEHGTAEDVPYLEELKGQVEPGSSEALLIDEVIPRLKEKSGSPLSPELEDAAASHLYCWVGDGLALGLEEGHATTLE